MPSPSWPSASLPQHLTAPPPVSAQVWEPPAVIAPTPLPRPLTATGVRRFVVVPSPSWPKMLLPQHSIMALRDRTLYVADVDELLEINAASGEIVNRYPAKGAIFLNDVAVGDDGTVYVSDTPMNTIWRLKDGTFEPWLANDDLNGPNGLLVQGDKLIVASFGKLPGPGQKQELGGLLAVGLENQSVSKLGNGETIGNLDGLQLLQPGVYLVTDWAAGVLYRVDAKGKADRLIKLSKGSADLIYLPDKKTVLIPIMLNNTLVAYALE